MAHEVRHALTQRDEFVRPCRERVGCANPAARAAALGASLRISIVAALPAARAAALGASLRISIVAALPAVLEALCQQGLALTSID
jgi:hypothetical protein